MKKVGAAALFLCLAGTVSTSVFLFLKAGQARQDADAVRKELKAAKETLAMQGGQLEQVQAKIVQSGKRAQAAVDKAKNDVQQASDLAGIANKAAKVEQENKAKAERELAGSNKALENLKKDLGEYQGAVDDLMSERQALEVSVKALKDQLAAEQESVKKTQSDLADAGGDKKALIDDLRDTQVELASTRKDKQALDDELKRAMKKMEDLQEEIITATAQVGSHKVQLQEKTAALERLGKAGNNPEIIATLRAEIRVLRAKLGLPPLDQGKPATVGIDDGLPVPTTKIPLAGRIKKLPKKAVPTPKTTP